MGIVQKSRDGFNNFVYGLMGGKHNPVARVMTRPIHLGAVATDLYPDGQTRKWTRPSINVGAFESHGSDDSTNISLGPAKGGKNSTAISLLHTAQVDSGRAISGRFRAESGNKKGIYHAYTEPKPKTRTMTVPRSAYEATRARTSHPAFHHQYVSA